MRARAAALAAVLTVAGCAFDDAAAELGRAMERAAARGAEVRIVCRLPLERLADCRPAAGFVTGN